jgi:hypothetical protein
MRRRGAEEAKVVIQRIPNKAKKKKFSRCSFRFPFTRRLDDDRLSPLKFCLLKKKILSLSLSLCCFVVPSSSLCKGEQQHKEMRREEEMTFSAKL